MPLSIGGGVTDVEAASVLFASASPILFGIGLWLQAAAIAQFREQSLSLPWLIGPPVVLAAVVVVVEELVVVLLDYLLEMEQLLLPVVVVRVCV